MIRAKWYSSSIKSQLFENQPMRGRSRNTNLNTCLSHHLLILLHLSIWRGLISVVLLSEAFYKQRCADNERTVNSNNWSCNKLWQDCPRNSGYESLSKVSQDLKLFFPQTPWSDQFAKLVWSCFLLCFEAIFFLALKHWCSKMFQRWNGFYSYWQTVALLTDSPTFLIRKFWTLIPKRQFCHFSVLNPFVSRSMKIQPMVYFHLVVYFEQDHILRWVHFDRLLRSRNDSCTNVPVWSLCLSRHYSLHKK